MNTSNSSNPDNAFPSALSSKPRNIPLFALGQIVATPAVLAHLNEHQIQPDIYIRRHQCGDWGNVPPEDADENDFSVLNGLRVLFSYEIVAERIWIITEADRSSTTLLFPSEY
jgi:hypothetical protein